MTRLFYEKMLAEKFPYLSWIRVCTSAPYTVTVYACNAALELNKRTITKLQDFLSEAGMASCIHNVKHYFELQNDQVFPIGQVPEQLKIVALKGDGSRAGVRSALRLVFPSFDPDRFEVNNDIVTFHLLKKDSWTSYEKRFAELMLAEIIPVGCTAILDTTPPSGA